MPPLSVLATKLCSQAPERPSHPGPRPSPQTTHAISQSPNDPVSQSPNDAVSQWNQPVSCNLENDWLQKSKLDKSAVQSGSYVTTQPQNQQTNKLVREQTSQSSGCN